MRNEGDADKLVFALYLNQESSGWVSKENSTLNFGNLNISRFSDASTFTYVQADRSEGTWKVPVTKPALGGEAIAESSKVGLLSTTNGKLVVPSKVYTALYGAICDSWLRYCTNRDRDILWNCTSTSQSWFDDLTFSVGGVEVTLTPYEYTRKSNRKDYCSLHFLEGDNWVLGTSFLTKYYTVFDLEQGRVGFAPAKHESEMSTWLVVVIVIVIALLVGCCAVLACVAIAKKKNQQGEEMNQPLLGQRS
jgi:cathepsin D